MTQREVWKVMKLCSDANGMMKRFNILFLNEVRECIFQKPLSEIDAIGKMLGPFKKGDKATLPNWIIESLLDHGIVQLTPDAYDSVRRLQNIYSEEEKQPHKLQDLYREGKEEQPTKFFYSALKRKLSRLQSDKTSLDPRNYEKIEKLQHMDPFFETRLSKIIRVAKSGAYHEKQKYMTFEERWLCEELIKLFSSWRQNIVE